MYYLGIDIGSEYLKYSLIDKRKGDLNIVKSGNFKITDTPLSINSEKRHLSVRVALQKTITEISRFYKKAELVLSVSGFMSQVRVIELPATSEKKLKDVLTYEAIQILPSTPEVDYIYSTAIMKADTAIERKGLVAISRKNDIIYYIDTLLELKFNLKKIILEPLAYLNIARELYFPHKIITCVVDIGFKSTTLIILKGEEILEIRMLPIGIGQTQKRLCRKLKVKPEQAKEIFDNWISREELHAEKEDEPLDFDDEPLDDLDDDIELPDFGDDESEDIVPAENNSQKVEPTKKERSDDDVIEKTITTDIKSIFSEIERSLSKVKSDHNLFKSKFKLLLTGSITAKDKFISIVKVTSSIPDIDNFDISSVFDNDITPGSINTCSHALAFSAIDDKESSINLIPESYAHRLKTAKKQKVLSAAIAALLILLPVPSLINTYKLRCKYKQVLSQSENNKNSYIENIEKEKKLDAELAEARKAVTPYREVKTLQYGILNSIAKIIQISDQNVWIKYLHIQPKTVSKTVSEIVEDKVVTKSVNCQVIECELKMQAASYQTLEKIIELLKSEPWTSSFSIKNASSLKISNGEFNSNLTLGAIDKQNTYGKKNVDAVIIFEVI